MIMMFGGTVFCSDDPSMSINITADRKEMIDQSRKKEDLLLSKYLTPFHLTETC